MIGRTNGIRQELARRHIINVLRQYTDGMTAGQINGAKGQDMSYLTYQDIVAALAELEEKGIVVYEKYSWKMKRQPGFFAALRRFFGI